MPRRTASIALGGVIGAAVRWGALELWPGSGIPWTVLAVNVVGSFVLGLTTSAWIDEERLDELGLDLHHGLTVGFCGGLTTMSTLAVDVGTLARGGDVSSAAVAVVLSLVTAVAAASGGLLLGSRWAGAAP